MNYNQNDIGAKLTPVWGGISAALAGGTGDATKATGVGIDTLGYDSAKAIFFINTTLASGKRLDAQIEYQFSANNSDFDTAVALFSDTVATAAGGAVTAGGYELSFDLDLQHQKRYVRFNYTPDLNATGTDLAYAQWGLVLGGHYTNV